MAELVTWCRLLQTGPACAKPCDDCRATSRKLAVAGIDGAALIEGHRRWADGEAQHPHGTGGAPT
jgi:hypothetical protein